MKIILLITILKIYLKKLSWKNPNCSKESFIQIPWRMGRSTLNYYLTQVKICIYNKIIVYRWDLDKIRTQNRSLADRVNMGKTKIVLSTLDFFRTIFFWIFLRLSYTKWFIVIYLMILVIMSITMNPLLNDSPKNVSEK